jgi:hypothetical protein
MTDGAYENSASTFPKAGDRQDEAGKERGREILFETQAV